MARKLGIYVAPIMFALAMTPASAALAITRSAAPGACTNWVHMTSPMPGRGDNNLYGVAATSPDNAWAVGEYFTGVDTKTLTEHWNGKSWKVVPSPNPGPDNLLQAVYAASATSVWAVGSYFNGTAGRTLIEHWNGKSWKVVPSPNIGSGSNEFVSVRGTSASNIWAAGDAVTSYPVTKNLIVHWDGSHWRVVSSPSVPNSPNFLDSVRPQSRTTGWAVGRYVHGTASRTLILRWSKGKWRIVPSPNAGSGTNALRGVVASSPTSSWAVGDYYTAPPTRPSSCTGTDGSGPGGQVPTPQRHQQQRPRRDRWHVGREHLLGGPNLHRHELAGAHPALERNALANRAGQESRDGRQWAGCPLRALAGQHLGGRGATTTAASTGR